MAAVVDTVAQVAAAPADVAIGVADAAQAVVAPLVPGFVSDIFAGDMQRKVVTAVFLGSAARSWGRALLRLIAAGKISNVNWAADATLMAGLGAAGAAGGWVAATKIPFETQIRGKMFGQFVLYGAMAMYLLDVLQDMSDTWNQAGSITLNSVALVTTLAGMVVFGGYVATAIKSR